MNNIYVTGSHLKLIWDDMEASNGRGGFSTVLADQLTTTNPRGEWPPGSFTNEYIYMYIYISI